MTSTSARGSASFASTRARAGRFSGSPHADHTSFIAARLLVDAYAEALAGARRLERRNT
jgi:hypothetical protein